MTHFIEIIKNDSTKSVLNISSIQEIVRAANGDAYIYFSELHYKKGDYIIAKSPYEEFIKLFVDHK